MLDPLPRPIIERGKPPKRERGYRNQDDEASNKGIPADVRKTLDFFDSVC